MTLNEYLFLLMVGNSVLFLLLLNTMYTKGLSTQQVKSIQFSHGSRFPLGPYDVLTALAWSHHRATRQLYSSLLFLVAVTLMSGFRNFKSKDL